MVLVLLCLAKDRLGSNSPAVILASLDTQIHVTTVRIIAESYVAMTVTTLFHAKLQVAARRWFMAAV